MRGRVNGDTATNHWSRVPTKDGSSHDTEAMNRNHVVRGKAVAPGDCVRLVSPSSFPTDEWLKQSIAVLEGWGLVVDVAPHATDRHGYMAGRDADRINDLNDAFRDPSVRAIVTTRGGAGASRIAERLDFDAVIADPKPLVGFSDITNIHLALRKHCRLVTVHGALAGANAQASVKHFLMKTEPFTVTRNPNALSAAVGVDGQASGPLIGGNLRELAGSVGAGLPNLDGAIVLLEDLRHVGIGQVDRNITQLRRSGALSNVAGIAIGLFDDFRDYIDRDWGVIDVLADRLTDLGVPVLGGLDIGHGGVGADGGPDQFAVALGAHAILDTTTGTLTVDPAVR